MGLLWSSHLINTETLMLHLIKHQRMWIFMHLKKSNEGSWNKTKQDQLNINQCLNMSVSWSLQLAGTGVATNIPKEDLKVQNLLWSIFGHVISLIMMNQRLMRN